MVCQRANIARLQRETKNEQIATDRGKLIYEWGWGGGGGRRRKGMKKLRSASTLHAIG